MIGYYPYSAEPNARLRNAQMQRAITQSLELVTGPTEEPVTPDQCKKASKIDYTYEDSLIGEWITQARQEVEEDANLCLLTQTWRLNLDQFPPWTVVIYKRPIASISSITYTDFDGSTQTLSTSYYTSDLTSFPPRVEPVWGQIWPVARTQPKSIIITFIAGATSVVSVSAIAKQAIRLRVAMNLVDRTGAEYDTFNKAFNAIVDKLKWGGIV